MNKKGKILIVILLSAACCAAAAFCFYKTEFIVPAVKTALYISTGIVFVCTALFYVFGKTSLFRLGITCIILALFFGILFYILDISGFWENVSSVEGMKGYIKSQGVYSGLIFFLIQMLQVIAIPIPGAVTVSVGSVLYGPVWGSLLSFAGIVSGSLIAFIIGRKFGYKLVTWIVGEEDLKKALKMIKGKDKVMFTMIFLLPFFPDDILCYVAGLTSMSLLFFTVMAMCTRVITILATVFFTQFVSFLVISETFWGYALLALICIALAGIFFVSVKYGEKIQDFAEKLFGKKGRKKSEGNFDTGKAKDK